MSQGSKEHKGRPFFSFVFSSLPLLLPSTKMANCSKVFTYAKEKEKANRVSQIDVKGALTWSAYCLGDGLQ